MGIETWSRNFDLYRPVCQYRRAGVKQATEQDALYTGSQTTTSFRSRKGIGEDPDTLQNGTSGSQGAFMKELKTEGRVRKTTWDNGNEFFSEKKTVLYPDYVDMIGSSGGVTETYTGYIQPGVNSITFPTSVAPTMAVINANGSKLISMTLPTAAEAGMTQFLGELREQLPSLIGFDTLMKGLGPNSLGREHLNYQFGIKPFLNDLQKMARGVLHHAKIVKQYQRNSDVLVHRHAVLREDRVYTQQAGIPGSYSMPRLNLASAPWQHYFLNQPVCTVSDVLETRIWFSGAYTYHLSQAHSFLGKMERYEQEANAFLGSRFDASTFWELTPWSWLVDWFADVGSFTANVSALSSDALVLRYGYVMHKTYATRTFAKVGCLPAVGASVPSAIRLFSTFSRKIRTRATPYGFGINVGALSPRRWAILGALGMTKAPSSLRLRV